MAEEQLTPEQIAEIVNKLQAENRTFRQMLADTAEKIANLELKNSELKVQNKNLQDVLAQISGQNAPEVPKTEEE
tara:strand:+ start:196 stop:420 length:225 start_codon:yes stop_codon:yes gene_type:complete